MLYEKDRFKLLFLQKNKLVLVNGTYPKPDNTSPLQPHWARANDMVISWILNTVTTEIADSVSYVTLASQMWKELEDRFSSINVHRIYQLQKELHSLEQEDKSVEIYFHKLLRFLG